MSASAAGTAEERGTVGVLDVVAGDLEGTGVTAAGAVVGAEWAELPSGIVSSEETAGLGLAREARMVLGRKGTWI